MTTLGALSDWQTTDLIGYLMTGEWWAALTSADPRVGSPTAHEFSGGSYARVLLEMEVASARVMRATNAPAWVNLPDGTIAWLALFTASVGGSLRAAIPLEDPYPVVAGAPYTVPANSIYVSW